MVQVTKSSFFRIYSPEAEDAAEPVPVFVRSYALLSEKPAVEEREIVWKGQRLVCPQNLRLRVLESTIAFSSSFRGLGVGLIPEEFANAADTELRAFHRRHPEQRSHVLTTAWHVPVRWFAAFEPQEKEVYDGPYGPRIRYRTEVEAARRRVRNAHQILKKLGVFSGPAEELEQLHNWLSQFTDRSVAEVDYDEVSELFDPQDLVFDNSCELIDESLDALASGDMMRAGENYGRVVSRWAPAFSVTFSN